MINKFRPIISARLFNTLLEDGAFESEYYINVHIDKEQDLLVEEIKKLKTKIVNLKDCIEILKSGLDFYEDKVPFRFKDDDYYSFIVNKIKEIEDD